MNKLTNAEVMTLLRGDTLLNKARKQFANWSGKIEQAGMQRKPLGSIELRRMEFEAVHAIATVLGVNLDDS